MFFLACVKIYYKTQNSTYFARIKIRSNESILISNINIRNSTLYLDRFGRGIYAISVSGRLPAGVIREMKSRGIAYKSRDTSQR